MSWVLERLSRAGQRFFGFIKQAVQRGISYFRFRRVAEEAGVPPERLPSETDFEVTRKALPQIQALREVPYDSLIPEHLYTPVSRITGGRYATTFRVRGVNVLTGEIEERYVTVVHDELMRRDELEMRVRGMFLEGEREGSPQFAILETEPVRAWKRVV